MNIVLIMFKSSCFVTINTMPGLLIFLVYVFYVYLSIWNEFK